MASRSGFELPRIEAVEDLGTAVVVGAAATSLGAWAVDGTKAIVARPIVAEAGWEAHCNAQ